MDNKIFTVNHVYFDNIKDAHHTSARYPSIISEFDMTGLEKEFIDDFKAPYVKSSKIKLGCKFINKYEIKENNTLLMVAEIHMINGKYFIIHYVFISISWNCSWTYNKT